VGQKWDFRRRRQSVGGREGEIKCRERLGGLLRYYHHGAA
jgi:hypothetical protein